MAAIPVSAGELANATAAAADMDTILKDGATLNGSPVIPPTTGFVAGNTQVADYFKAATIIQARHGGAGGAFLSAFNNTGHSIGSNNTQTIVNFNVAVKDTVSGLTAGASWIWVPGQLGLYQVETMIQISGPSGVGITGTPRADLILYRVSSLGAETFDSYIGTGQLPNVDNNFIKGSQMIEITDATQGIRLKARTASSQAQFITTIGGGAQTNYIRIYRMGGT
jgi:hypothetical protein